MRENTKNKLYDFILEQLSQMTEKVLSKYKNNMVLREQNPFLALDNVSTEKFMALGRSIDSQLGNRLQNIIFYLTRIRYGYENVPNIVEIITNHNTVELKKYYITGVLDKNYFYSNSNYYSQKIYINKNLSETDIQRKLHVKKAFVHLIASSSIPFEVEENTINLINTIAKEKGTDGIPVDLLFFDNNFINTFEIKMSGNLDTKNAESNAAEVNRLKNLFSFTNNNSYFATCYLECSHAVFTEMKKLNLENNIYKSIDFWNVILPNNEETLTYQEFVDLYTKAFHEAKLEERIVNEI